MRLITFLILDVAGALLWAGLLAGLGYALGHRAVVAATAISHYSLWVTIGIVALSVLFIMRSQRPAENAPGRPGQRMTSEGWQHALAVTWLGEPHKRLLVDRTAVRGGQGCLGDHQLSHARQVVL